MSFSKTSTGFWLNNSHILVANLIYSGGTKQSSIDLNLYIGNSDGFFQWGGQNYSLTGSNFRLDGPKLVGNLKKNDGSSRELQGINLDDKIANINGVLVYQP